MTKMQVEWMNADENVRHNKAMEEEQQRHNVETESLTRESNALTRQMNEETIRTHKVNEALSASQLNEQIRHQQAQDAELLRHNGATEAEISLHNRETEKIQRDANAIKVSVAEISAAATREASKLKGSAQVAVAKINAAVKEADRYWNNIWRAVENIREDKLASKSMQLTDANIAKVQNEIADSKMRLAKEIDKWDQEMKESQQRIKESETRRKVSVAEQIRKYVDSYANGVYKAVDSILRFIELKDN